MHFHLVLYIVYHSNFVISFLFWLQLPNHSEKTQLCTH